MKRIIDLKEVSIDGETYYKFGNHFLTKSDVEEYTEELNLSYLNCTFKVIEINTTNMDKDDILDCADLTIGNTYSVINGIFEDDINNTYPIFEPLKSTDELVAYLSGNIDLLGAIYSTANVIIEVL